MKKSSIIGIIVFVAFVILFINKLINDPSKNSKDHTSSETTTTEEKPKEIWQLRTFADNFGDETREQFIYYTAIGTFSNSATINSFLGVEIIITKTNAGILLHEYSWNSQAQYFIGGGTIELKNDYNSKISLFTSGKWNDNGGVLIPKSKYEEFKTFLVHSRGRVVKAYIKDTYSSSYRFDINLNGFTYAYSQL